MKNKLYFFLLTTLMGLFGMNASAQDPYEISTAQDLMAFADLVNGGETGTNAVLTADIDMTDLLSMEAWTPIGKDGDHKYTGTFDGQGNSITGFKYTPTEFNGTANYSGLFGIVRNATIKNFYIEGTLTVVGGVDSKTYTGTIAGAEASSVISGIHSAVNVNVSGCKAHTGGILGSTITSGNPVLVENCEYSGTLTHSGTGDCQAGILGYTYNGGVKNCIFSGTIIGENNKYGGILGYCKITTFLGVQNCLSIGKIVANEGCTTAAAIIANWNGGATENVKNNYYCLAEGSTTTIAIGNKASSCEAPVAVTAEQLASGEVCYLLNGEQSNIAFYQTLNDDEAPVLDSTHGTVYLAGRSHCDGTPYEGVSGYSNTASVVDDHDFVDGFCTYCETLDEDYIIPNNDDFLEIGTPAQLKWFAVYVNQVEPASNAMLTADIDLAGVTMPSIGNSSVAYAGRFYGQGNAISNFEATSEGYGGFFGKTNGADIRDFSISGTLTVAAGTGSGVVGWAENSTISNIQSALVIEVPNSGAHHTGGVVGSARGTNFIDRCSFSGSMTIAAGSTDNFAGVVAYVTHSSTTLFDVVTNCANYGDITFSDAGCAAGGVLGYINSANAIVNNCLNTGSITFNGEGSPKFGGAILGRTKNTDFTKITNNFWLEGSSNGASKKDDGSDPVATGSVTAEQLASGEVAYKLGEAWSQIIGTDDVPVLGTDAPVFYVGEAGYATLYDTTTGYKFNGDVTASVAVLTDTWLELTEIENVPAGTPVILKGTYFNKTAADLSAINIANDLKGTDVATKADGTMYVLAKPAEKEVGFYKATGTIPAGKAYFQSNAGVKAFFFDGDDATGIENLNNQNTLNTPIYNLAGQRMSKMQKGINIVDGKKILK